MVGALVALPGCIVVVDDGGSGGQGMVDEVRQVADFDAVANESRVDVEIAVADVSSATVHCPEHLLNNVSTDVVDGELRIGDSPEGLFATGWSQCWVEVGVPHLSAIALRGSGDVSASGPLSGFASAELDGSGDLSIDGIDSNTVDLSLLGAGDLVALGTADSESLTLNGSGDLDADGLHVVDADVVSNGSGDATLHATGTVSVQLGGSGDVRIGGNPTDVDVHDNGSGDVILD
jgi:hypothetical protein